MAQFAASLNAYQDATCEGAEGQFQSTYARWYIYVPAEGEKFKLLRF